MKKILFLMLLFLALSLPGDVNGADFAGSSKHVVASIRTVYSSTPVTTAANVTILASAPVGVNGIEIFDSSGQALTLTEFKPDCTTMLQTKTIFPGGNGYLPLSISPGSCLALKAITATANGGENDIDLYQ